MYNVRIRCKTIFMKSRFYASILLYNFIGLTVAVGGWLWEVLLFYIKDREFVNRGFLHGPYLPIYGIGAAILSFLFYYKDVTAMITYAHLKSGKYPKFFYHGHIYGKLKELLRRFLPLRPAVPIKVFPHRAQTIYKSKMPSLSPAPKIRWQLQARFKKHGQIMYFPSRKQLTKDFSKFTAYHPHHLLYSIRIFLICMFGGSLVELTAGFFLWHAFHVKYWDYSGYLLNIGGYVCLFSALGFGIFGVIWLNWISPPLIQIWERLRFSVQLLIIGLLDMSVITDIIFSSMLPNSGNNITFSLLL